MPRHHQEVWHIVTRDETLRETAAQLRSARPNPNAARERHAAREAARTQPPLGSDPWRRKPAQRSHETLRALLQSSSSEAIHASSSSSDVSRRSSHARARYLAKHSPEFQHARLRYRAARDEERIEKEMSVHAAQQHRAHVDQPVAAAAAAASAWADPSPSSSPSPSPSPSSRKRPQAPQARPSSAASHRDHPHDHARVQPQPLASSTQQRNVAPNARPRPKIATAQRRAPAVAQSERVDGDGDRDRDEHRATFRDRVRLREEAAAAAAAAAAARTKGSIIAGVVGLPPRASVSERKIYVHKLREKSSLDRRFFLRSCSPEFASELSLDVACTNWRSATRTWGLDQTHPAHQPSFPMPSQSTAAARAAGGAPVQCHTHVVTHSSAPG